ncbi:TRAP-type C4-dicarboxylate transport system permease small subunit [Amorphus sp. MBR-141]
MQLSGIATGLGRLGSGASNVCAAVTLAAIVVLMAVDVTARYLFNSPVPGAGEIIELAMAVLVFSALPMTTLRREHVTLDYLEHLLPANAQRVVGAIADIATAAILGFLAWRLMEKSATIVRYGDTTPYLSWPIAPIAIFMSAMSAVTAVLLAISAFRPRRRYESFEEGSL